MPPRPSAYGSVSALFGKPMPFHLFGDKPTLFGESHKRAALPVLVGCLFVPWLLFTATFWMKSFELRRDSETLANVLCNCLLCPVVAFAWMTSNMVQLRMDDNLQPRLVASGNGDPKPMGFLTATSLLAWILAISLGDFNYHSFMRPYYEINDLNVYPNVDPSKYVGSQLMDAGMIQFATGSVLRLDKSIGFKNDQVYCVAPVASSTNTNQSTYDFWAIGMNCCSGHLPDFKCGEYSNPSARWGLRLMDDSQRKMFGLAVKEAEATFKLKASNPILMYWLSDPTAEVNAYQDDGFSYFYMFTFGYFAVQLFLVLCAALTSAKLDA